MKKVSTVAANQNCTVPSVRYSARMLTRVGIVALAIAGIAVFVRAKHFSDFEKRLKDAYPKTKVTGWSGTQKGVVAWRCVGILIVLLSLLMALDPQTK